jgi:hypothetical protein
VRSEKHEMRNLDETEWEVLYLLVDALDQLRKMTLSFSELRYLAVEHTEAQLRTAVEALAKPDTAGVGGGAGGPDLPLIVQVPNLANLAIYRITPTGRDLVQARKAVRPGSARQG